MNLDATYTIPMVSHYRASLPLPAATWEVAAPFAGGVPALAWALGPPAARSPRGRRAAPGPRMIVRFAGFELDCIGRLLVAPGGGTERLPGLEFALLQIFVSRPHAALDREELARQLTRDRGTRLSGRTVDSYVSRLRRRLARAGASALVETMRTTGYRFAANVTRA